MNRPRSAWRLIGLLSATATASYLCRVNLSVAGVLLMQEYGFSQVVMGRVFSAFLLGYALFQIPGGMLADRYGARRVLALRFLLGVGEAHRRFLPPRRLSRNAFRRPSKGGPMVL